MAIAPAIETDVAYWTDGESDIPVYQRLSEFEWLLDRYTALAPRRVLEIGVGFGGTLRQWLKYTPGGAHIVSVDLHEWDGAAQPTLWQEWAREFGQTLTHFAGSSQDAAIIRQVQSLGPYDFIFVDGDHRAEAALADYHVYRPMLRPQGMMAFHDIVEHPANPDIQTWQVWRMICAVERTTRVYIDDEAARWGGLGVILG